MNDNNHNKDQDNNNTVNGYLHSHLHKDYADDITDIKMISIY